MSPNRQYVASASADQKVIVWDAASGIRNMLRFRLGSIFEVSTLTSSKPLQFVLGINKLFFFLDAIGIQLCEADNCGLLKDVMWSKDSKQVVACTISFLK